MTNVRLLPIVVMAASALLVLKTAGLVTDGGYTLWGTPTAFAQDEPVRPDPPLVIGESPVASELDFGYSPEQLEAAEAAARSLFSSPPQEAGPTDTHIYQHDGQGEAVPLAEGARTQQVIEERLGERRSELDALEEELETRLALIEAAEARIEERMAELSQVEARINAMVDAQEQQEAEQFARLVTMYENMRPAEAAAIFDDLEIAILTRVGREMNPRRLGPIIARMSSAKAQELTVRLARSDAGQDQPPPAQHAELPQIVGQ